MQKQYRIEVSRFWQHPTMDFGKWRQQVYDFSTGTLIHDERSWADGQDFYDPKRSSHIYADKEKADAIFDELDFTMGDWEPLGDIIFEGSGEHLISYRLIAVDENSDEEIVFERDIPELLSMINETLQKTTATS